MPTFKSTITIRELALFLFSMDIWQLQLSLTSSSQRTIGTIFSLMFVYL